MEERGYQATPKQPAEITQRSPRQALPSASGSALPGLDEHAGRGRRGGVARGAHRMIINEEGESVYEETTQKKKKVKSTGSQTVIKIEEDLQSDTQAKTKVKKKKCLAEEDSDQLNLSKKNKVGSKLNKRACSDSPVTIESNSESEPVKEIKKKSKVFKKKSKKGQGLSLLPLENNQDSDQYLPKKYTIHSQENTVIGKNHRENISQYSEGHSEVTKKKKKKKERDISSLTVIEILDSDHEISNKNLKKINKTTLREKALAGKKHRKDIVQNSAGESDIMKKKKKKDKRDSLTLAGDQDNNPGVSEKLSTRDFRKNQETNSQENTLIRKKQKENIVQNSESDREVTKRKKKSKDFSSLTCEDNQDQSHGVSNKHLPRKEKAKSQEKAHGKKHREYSEDDSEVTKKKKKKIQKEEEKVTEPVNLMDEDGEISEGEKMTPIKSNRKNKKKKSKPTEDLAVDNIDEGLRENNNVHCDNKGKKRNKQGSQNCAEEPRLKKKKVTVKTENEAMECKDDVTVVEERKGNCDEINIDKVRRQALQEEIDRESGKTKVFRNKVESQDIKFGQWSTATFESSDQKTKFLKLMGGFKKSSASTQDPPGTTEKLNMALNKKGEDTLKQTLQMESDKAINLKQHRGIGLGFQPIANKKVYIDKYVSKSIKFED
ncbi:lysine-rich nucleolar protein 1 isoform X1 [Caretta caretta]|uniref:lysine-rich nucleolar protein 1 isoform X1 n=2 Tax=Caretta caretta TaxID=8467 RepID=UPI00209564C9|nr:lysine-rich nucleolar protein 1 isoform X1 [Caretta caretta]